MKKAESKWGWFTDGEDRIFFLFLSSGIQRQERRDWNYFIPRNYKGEASCCCLTYFELREERMLSTSPLWPVAKCIISALSTQAKCQSLKPSPTKSIFLGLNQSCQLFQHYRKIMVSFWMSYSSHKCVLYNHFWPSQSARVRVKATGPAVGISDVSHVYCK